MQARIYKPSKTAMQSGRGKTRSWVLEFNAEVNRTIEPLMGWTSVDDNTGQVQLRFDTRDEAIAYARRNNLTFTVEEAPERKRLVKSYAANFSHDRKRPWTH
jgi:hypothetical protein